MAANRIRTRRLALARSPTMSDALKSPPPAENPQSSETPRSEQAKTSEGARKELALNPPSSFDRRNPLRKAKRYSGLPCTPVRRRSGTEVAPQKLAKRVRVSGGGSKTPRTKISPNPDAQEQRRTSRGIVKISRIKLGTKTPQEQCKRPRSSPDPRPRTCHNSLCAPRLLFSIDL